MQWSATPSPDTLAAGWGIQSRQSISPLLATLDRYILREVLVTLGATLLVLLLLLLTHRFGNFLNQAARGGLAQGAIVQLLGLHAVRYIVDLIPAATLLALMLALGRLHRDSEMVAIAACGLGPRAIYRPLLLLTLPLAVILAALSLELAPTASRLQYEVRDRAQQEAELWLIQPGSFREIDGGRHIVYVGALSNDGRQLRDIFIYTKGGEDDAASTIVTSASRGYQLTDSTTGARHLVLDSGQRYQGTPGTANYQIASFKQLKIRIAAPNNKNRRVRVKTLPTRELLGSDEPHHIGELQSRISPPLALILVTLLAPLLANANQREGRYGRIVAAILVYAVYLNLLGVGKAWLENEIMPAALGLWWVHALLALTVAALGYIQSGKFLLRRQSSPE